MRTPLLALLLGLFTVANVEAQAARDFSTVRFRPPVGPGNYIALDGSEVLTARATSYALGFDYAAKPLVAERPCSTLSGVARCEERDVALIQGTALVHLGFAIGLGQRIQIGLSLPLGVNDTKPFSYWAAQPMLPSMYRELRTKNGFALGDLRLVGKMRVYGADDHRFRLAALVSATLPTARATSDEACFAAENCTFLGDRTTQVGAHAIAEMVPTSQLRVAVTLGAVYRPHERVLSTEVGSELAYGAAVAYQPLSRLGLKVELQGALELQGEHEVPLEARGAVGVGRDLVFQVGAGAGLTRAVGAPDYRIAATLVWTPKFRDADGDGREDDADACPSEPEDRDDFEDSDGCPEADNDEDGIADAIDKCDDQVEDRDGFADDDGCPELDNDEDGVPDGYDTCEGQKEDRDGDHDDDGCPDLDTDRDGVLDASDKCIHEAEDTDGLADDDGCPEADFDQDGFDDRSDACPEEPGARTGAPGDDGCPP